MDIPLYAAPASNVQRTMTANSRAFYPILYYLQTFCYCFIKTLKVVTKYWDFTEALIVKGHIL